MTLKGQMEARFDPTDADNAMQLAYAALDLAAVAATIPNTSEEQLVNITMAVHDIGQRLKLLPFLFDGQELLAYMKGLEEHERGIGPRENLLVKGRAAQHR